MKPDPDLQSYNQEFAANYDTLNYGRSLAGRMLRHSHVLAERRFGPKDHFGSVLEVGAGTGEHLNFVRHEFDMYFMTDIEPEMLSRLRVDMPEDVRRKVRIEQQDATALTYGGGQFDRIVAAHVLEHLPNPHLALREWYRLVRPGGIISVVLPCDPGLLWRLGRYFGPRRRAQKAGLPYDYVMAREHVNSITNLVALFRYYFDRIEEIWYPSRLPITDANLFYICHIWRD